MALRHRARPHSAFTNTHSLRLPVGQGIQQFDFPQSPHRSLPVPVYFDADRTILITVTILAFITRFYRIHIPKAVVFDELHFGAFLENHLNGKFTFDIHPWLGKLTLAAFSYLFGFRPTGMDYVIRNPYPTNDYIIPRAISAAFGTFCVPLFFLICRELCLSHEACLMGTLLPLLDNLLIIESRLILLDSQLIFYLALTLLFALRLWRAAEDGRRGSTYYFALLVNTATVGAAAISIKWTAVVTPLLVTFVSVFNVPFLTRRLHVFHCVLAAVVAIIVYVIPWYIHLFISTQSTPLATEMSERFRSTLHGNESLPYDPNNNMTFIEKLGELHWRQFDRNRKIKTRHKWESRWYEWPLNQRGIFYYVEKVEGYTEETPLIRIVYLLQNPVTAFVVAAGVLAAIIWLFMPSHSIELGDNGDILRRARAVTFAYGGASIGSDAHARGIVRFLLVGYILNIAPFVLVKRCYFLYHYLPALMYGQILVAVMMDRLPRGKRIKVLTVVAMGVVSAFVFWSPWVYSFTMDYKGFLRRQWMSRWN